ncbi:MAG: S10 family peptidase [Acidobacteriota bacterium]
MIGRRIFYVSLVVLFIVSFHNLAAQETPLKTPEETLSVTKHSIQIDGKTLNYTAAAGTILLKEDNGKPLASFFFIAFTKDDVKDKSRRPLLFSFNGGPGTASVWLHLGALGPRRVLYDDEGFALQPPYKLVDNEYSVLDVTDIVFIDPVATGYSRMVPGEDPHKYHGVMEDIESVGEFIRLYVTRNKRWESPKFVIGESYGTTRASGLAGHLQDRHLMYLNGVMLISTTSLGVETGEDLGYALIIPHYAATAWYHKKLPSDLQSKKLRDVLDEVEKFASGEYILALVKGNQLTADERAEIVRKLSRYTGISADYIEKANLRIERSRFRKELLRDENRTVGRLDSRYKGIDRDSAGERNEHDPAMGHWEGTFAGTFNHYIRTELKYETDLSYEIWGDVRPWKRDRFVSVGEMLRRAMTKNEYLKVFIAEGYYDAACDYFTAQYVFSHLDLTGELKDRITFGFYESGHMMYIRKASLAKLKNDLAEFMQSALPK